MIAIGDAWVMFGGKLNAWLDDPARLTAILTIGLGLLLIGVLVFLYPLGKDN